MSELLKLFNKGVVNGLSSSDYIEVIEQLQKQNEILRKAVEYYASKESYHFNEDDYYFNALNYHDCYFDRDDGLNTFGGKTARQALEQCKELEG